MTVKCLTDYEKNCIAALYTKHSETIDELAYTYKCSTRTINRVLDEQGVVVPRRTRTTKPKPVLITELPTLTRYETFKCLLKAIFRVKRNDQTHQ